MLYPVCPTCNTLLADKQLPFEEGIKKIVKKNLNEKEQIIEKKKLLDNLGLKNYCCRCRMISYIDQAKLII